MKLLDRDDEILRARFPEAVKFIEAANLRSEMYKLVLKGPRRTLWEEQRVHELSHAPACKEPWFLEMVRGREAFAKWRQRGL